MREIIKLIYKIKLFKRAIPSILKRIIKIINKKSTIIKYENVLFDLKRLGNNKSFLVQFDCVFIRRDSNLLNVKF